MTPVGKADDDYIILGRIQGVYGVRGWVKIFSETQPRDNILSYRTWWLSDNGQWRAGELEDGRQHGKGLVAKLRGVDDRDAAAALHGMSIAIQRSQLPPAAEGEFYWADLVGLEVYNLDRHYLGRVDYLFETGANDVLVVLDEQGQERLIPFVTGSCVRQVDLAQRQLLVDWDPDF